MNKMKKVVALFLSLTMTIALIGTVNAAGEEDATVASWKVSAIITPEENKLVGAGYINIKVDTSLSEATSYKVVFDNVETETFNANDSLQQVAEVYTTEISAHTAYVVATLSDGTEITSDTRKFYVSKKGIALGSDMSETIELKKMNLAWYYNWKAEPYNDLRDDQVDHVPMIWGRNEDDPNGTKDENLYAYIKSQCDLVSDDANYILGYNEPNLTAQANISVVQAQEGWKYIEKLGKRTVSPSVSDPNGTYNAWLTPFLQGGEVYSNGVQVTVEGVSCDCVALHAYIGQRSVDRVINAVKNIHELYGKPVWITEMGIFGSTAYGDQYDYSYGEEQNRLTGEFIREVCTQLDELDYVERYAWFPYNIHSANDIDSFDASGSTALFDYESGKLTDNGFLYASLGLPEGYPQTKLTDSDKYVYVEPSTEKETTTKVPAITKKPEAPIVPATTAKAPSKLDKVKIRQAKNIKKKSVKISWKKVKGAKKYQIQYSLKRNFKKVKTKTSKKLSITIKKLNKKKYYFRVRAIAGKNKGKWSVIKAVKVKK